jgi:protein-tyrosine phosphatase
VIDRDATSLVDIHNHLVPGVDDGARNLPAVLESVERMTRLGIRRIVTTPHLQGSLTFERARYAHRMDEVTEAYEQAREAIEQSFPEVQFDRGHEVLIDVPEVDFSDPRIRLAETSFVLIEWPRLQVPPGTPRVIESIRNQGYRPIVAHPERYADLTQTLALAGRWREVGAYLQVNFGSLVGRYGKNARLAALQLLRQGWVDYMASDFHGHPTIDIYLDEALREFHYREAIATAEILCRANPARLLENLEPLPVPSLPSDPGFLTRLGRILKSTSR